MDLARNKDKVRGMVKSARIKVIVCKSIANSTLASRSPVQETIIPPGGIVAAKISPAFK